MHFLFNCLMQWVRALMYGKEAEVLKLKSILKSPNYVGVLLVEFSVMCFSRDQARCDLGI